MMCFNSAALTYSLESRSKTRNASRISSSCSSGFLRNLATQLMRSFSEKVSLPNKMEQNQNVKTPKPPNWRNILFYCHFMQILIGSNGPSDHQSLRGIMKYLSPEYFIYLDEHIHIALVLLCEHALLTRMFLKYLTVDCFITDHIEYYVNITYIIINIHMKFLSSWHLTNNVKKEIRKAWATQAIISSGCTTCFITVLKSLLRMWYAQCGLTTWQMKGRYGKPDQAATSSRQLIVDWTAENPQLMH